MKTELEKQNIIEEKRYTQSQFDIALITTKLSIIEKKVDSIDTKLNEDYVTQDEIKPLKSIVYGMVGIILTGVVGAVLALVVKQ